MKAGRPKKVKSQEPTLFDCSVATEHPGGVESIAHAFKKLYYHLYTNSQASRAERIVSDLSLLLLAKLSIEVNGGQKALASFLSAKASSQETLIPLLAKAYPGQIDPQERFGMGDDALREAFNILSELNLAASPAHVLGDAFQSLIGPRLRGDKGQFFTPRSLVRAMVYRVAPQPGESVLDPACGTGGFLAETHLFQVATSAGKSITGRLVGIDKDHDLFRISSALLRITSGKRVELFNNNSLDPDTVALVAGPERRFDVILTNPPFGSKIGVRDARILREYELAYQWIQRGGEKQWQRTEVLSLTQDPQVLFLEQCIKLLKPGGRLGIVLPEGLYGNKRTAYIWQWIRSKGKITALLDCPRTTFQPGTDTKTNVLFFEKSAHAERISKSSTEQVQVAVAIHCGHDRRGRTHYQDGTSYPDDFAALCTPEGSKNNGWKSVKIKHSDYLVPRYYVDRKLSREEESIVDGAKFVSLGDLKEKKIISIRKGHEVGSHAYGTGDYPFVRTSDVNNYEISVDPTNAVSETVYEEYAPQQKLEPGDILMVVDGRYRIGAMALLSESNYRCVVQSHFRIISIAKQKVLTPFELMYALSIPAVKMQLRNLVFVQSTLGTLGNRLLELEIPLLHGDGPWAERVKLFQDLLVKRDASLSQLRRMMGPECEL
jgi:type I restriction enzyme M protein